MKFLAKIDVELTSASPETLLNALNDKGITIRSVKYIDTLHIRMTIAARDLLQLKKIVTVRGDALKLLQKTGIQYTLRHILCRPVLLLGLLLWIGLLVYLPTRIWFVEVTGNSKISTEQITGCANDCGIFFGASRRNVRSEKVKNALLGMIPQLQWIGVNTQGCRAIISVVERSIPDAEQKDNQLRSIIAGHDAIVSSVIVQHGNGLCKPGQAVRKGQLLVSPYTDCGLSIKAESAEAEIFGQTSRKFNAVTPLKISKRGDKTAKTIIYGLRIGNKIINFSKDSGILDTTCVKMYEEKVICLPGGFALPVAVIKQTTVYNDLSEGLLYEEDVDCWMESELLKYINTQMLSGKVLQKMCVSSQSDESYFLYGNYVCEEMIGKFHVEEMLPDYG